MPRAAAAQAPAEVLDIRPAPVEPPAAPALPAPRAGGPAAPAAGPAPRARVHPASLPSVALAAVAGADRGILAQAPARERTKQAALGAVLLGSAAMAGVSAGYAVHVTFSLAPGAAALVALPWALFVLAIDRWLVVATPRLARAWQSVAMALPRVALALLIGTVMSEPLVLAVFGAEIRPQLAVMAAARDSAYTTQLARSAQYRALPAQERQVAHLQAVIAAGVTTEAVRRDPAVVAAQRALDGSQAQLATAQQAVEAEVDGSEGSGHAGLGPSAQLKLAARDAAAARASSAQQALAATTATVTAQRQAAWQAGRADDAARLATLAAQVRTERSAMAADLAAHRAASADGGGLLDRMGALAALERSDPALRAAHVALFAVLASLECLPVVFKTLLQLAPPSTYERLAAMEDEAATERLRRRHGRQRAEDEAFAVGAAGSAQVRADLTRDADAAHASLVLDAQLAVTRARLAAWQAAEGAEGQR